jgi:hypothetical protein
MKRLVVLAGIVTLVAALVAGASPATAGKGDGIAWSVADWAAGVQMYTSEPSATDLHVHVKFKRAGGEGLREVRVGERHKVPGTHQWGPYAYTSARLAVGQRYVFTTEAALPCEPAKEPLGVTVDMRIRQPGKPWNRWQTWITGDWYLLDCSPDQ